MRRSWLRREEVRKVVRGEEGGRGREREGGGGGRERQRQTEAEWDTEREREGGVGGGRGGRPGRSKQRPQAQPVPLWILFPTQPPLIQPQTACDKLTCMELHHLCTMMQKQTGSYLHLKTAMQTKQVKNTMKPCTQWHWHLFGNSWRIKSQHHEYDNQTKTKSPPPPQRKKEENNLTSAPPPPPPAPPKSN